MCRFAIVAAIVSLAILLGISVVVSIYDAQKDNEAAILDISNDSPVFRTIIIKS